MAGIDDVLERLVTDPGFRARLASDPTGSLAGYDLTADDLRLLSSQLDATAGNSGGVEARTSKAGLFGLLGGMDELAEAIGAGDGVGDGAGDGASGGPSLTAGEEDAADKDHKKWITIEAMSTPLHRSADPLPADLVADSEPVAAEGPSLTADEEDAADKDHKKWITIEAMSTPLHRSPDPLPADLAADSELVAAEGGAGDGSDVLTGNQDSADAAGTGHTRWIELNSLTQAVGESPGDNPPIDVSADAGPVAAREGYGGEIEIESFAFGQQTGADGDADVDGRDFLVWQRGSSPSAEPPAAGPRGEIEIESFSLGTPTPAASGGGVPTESLSLNFEEIKFNYDPAALGSAGTGGGAGDDLLIGGRTSFDEPSATPEGTVDKDETITIHGGRTEGGDDGGEAAASAGDADGDGDVDGSDFLVWQRGSSPATPSGGVTEYTYDSVGRLEAAGGTPSSGGTDAGGASPPDLRSDEPAPTPAIELENVQITSYQLGVLDNAGTPDPADAIATGSSEATAPPADAVEPASDALAAGTSRSSTETLEIAHAGFVDDPADDSQPAAETQA